MSLFRRAGAGIARFVERVGNPGALADRLALYSKDDGGVSHLFAQVSDGTVYQLTPPANAVWRFTLGPIQDIPDAVTSFAPTTTYHRFTVSGGNQNIVAIPTIVWPSAVAGQLVVLHNVTPSGGNWVRLNRGVPEALALSNSNKQLDPGGSMMVVYDGAVWTELTHIIGTTT